MTTYNPGSPLADFKRVEEIRAELDDILKREEKRHMMDADPYFQNMLEEVIDRMDEYLGYDPSPIDGGGEPPITAAEMHSAAWQQHQELHR